MGNKGWSMFDQVVMEGFFEARTLKWRHEGKKEPALQRTGNSILGRRKGNFKGLSPAKNEKIIQ